MKKTTIIRKIYPAIKILSLIYFWLLDFWFNFFNLFRSRSSLPQISNDLLFLSATDAAEKIRNRKILCSDLIAAYITRIKAVNPIINAITEDNFEEALKQAAEIDAYLDTLDKDSEEFERLPQDKPLLGIPISIKDTFAVKDFHHAVGIVARKNVIATEDAEVVKLIKNAGAIIIAITNVPEAAVWVDSVNKVYGRTKNAYDSRRAAGGSSGGEGALIGSGASIMGTGSDLAGSVRIPAQFNGIYGLKPSEFAIPIKGHHPCFKKGYPASMGNVGPLCRYAKDLPLFFRVLTGSNEMADTRFQLSNPVKMENIRFFYMEGMNSVFVEPLQDEMKKAMMSCVTYFEEKYKNDITRVDFAKLHHALSIYLISLSETRDAPFAHLIKNMEGEVSVVSEFLKKLYGKSDHTLPTLMILAMDDLPPTDQKTRAYVEKRRDMLRQEIIDLLKDDGILIFPSWPSTAFYQYKALGAMWSMMYTAIWNALRLPAIVCPMGLNKDGIPLSVQMIAGPDQERLLMAAAQDLESNHGGWVSAWGNKQ